ncbi:MAG: M23 family metallopeptidase, partial [archaeon]
RGKEERSKTAPFTRAPDSALAPDASGQRTGNVRSSKRKTLDKSVVSLETKNVYSYPIEERYIQKVVTKESPAHRVYKTAKGVTFDLTNAFDFLCNIGTPVKVAFKGKVFDVRDDLKESYNGFKFPSEDVMPEEKQDGNFVVIRHMGDEFSIYSHLGYKQISLEKGQMVKTGDILGYSGETGWSIKPHLHFMVFNFIKGRNPSEGLKSLQINWKK